MDISLGVWGEKLDFSLFFISSLKNFAHGCFIIISYIRIMGHTHNFSLYVCTYRGCMLKNPLLMGCAITKVGEHGFMPSRREQVLGAGGFFERWGCCLKEEMGLAREQLMLISIQLTDRSPRARASTKGIWIALHEASRQFLDSCFLPGGKV